MFLLLWEPFELQDNRWHYTKIFKVRIVLYKINRKLALKMQSNFNKSKIKKKQNKQKQTIEKGGGTWYHNFLLLDCYFFVFILLSLKFDIVGQPTVKYTSKHIVVFYSKKKETPPLSITRSFLNKCFSLS